MRIVLNRFLLSSNNRASLLVVRTSDTQLFLHRSFSHFPKQFKMSAQVPKEDVNLHEDPYILSLYPVINV